MIETAHIPTPMAAPALFLGIQPGFGDVSAIELYVLLSPVGHHPIGSTVSRQTLERHGYNLMIDHRNHTDGVASKKETPSPLKSAT